MKAGLPETDQTYVWHPFTQMKDWVASDYRPLVLVSGRGAVLIDEQGREYIDGNASIWTNIHGHCHPHINAAIASQLDRVAHVSFLGTSNEPAIRLAEKLVSLLGGTGLGRVFYSDDGSTAIEVAVKMALQYFQLTGAPGRRRFVSFTDAYHGDTAGAASLGGVGAFFDRFAPVHFEPIRVSSIEDLESLSADDAATVAAVVIEPVVRGVAGIRLWPDGMLSEIRHWCDSNGALLIYDEVLTGFGRTGRMFAFEREDVPPDFLCLAKGLTGGYLPLAATVTTARIFDAFLGEYAEMKAFFYGHSYCGNPLGCSAALASLEVFENERVIDSLPPKVEAVADAFGKLLDFPNVVAFRQCGLISGIQLGEPDGSALEWTGRYGARVCEAARRHGLLTRPILDVVPFIPPLCISTSQIADAARALHCALKDVFGR